jgi:hypothetical protein
VAQQVNKSAIKFLNPTFQTPIEVDERSWVRLPRPSNYNHNWASELLDQACCFANHSQVGRVKKKKNVNYIN